MRSDIGGRDMKTLGLALILVLAAQEDPVRKWIDRLGSEDLAERDKAAEELFKLGNDAVPHLEKALQHADPEVRTRARTLLGRLSWLRFRGMENFRSRLGGKRDAVLGGGGGVETEDAVLGALKWLSRHQSADGSWKVRGHAGECHKLAKYGGEKCPAMAGHEDFDTGVTGLAVLAFLGAGYSHLSKDTYDGIGFGNVVGKGLDWLMERQDKGGCVGGRNTQKYMYCHSIGALALAEAAALGAGEKALASAKKAVEFTVAAQNPGKGWRYSYKCGDNDTSVTMWAALSLRMAWHSGIDVPESAFQGVKAWLGEVTEESYGRTGYTHRGTGKVFVPGLNENYDHHEALTAVAVFHRIVAGEGRGGLPRQGCELLIRDLPAWEGNSIDFYYWHLATLALFQLDDAKLWGAWNARLKEALVPTQRRAADGCRAGSWETVDRWSGEAGRVYATALNAMTLQTYYRYRAAPRE
jgi:hypothetical protein